jgi:hypothetical protein
MKDLSALVTASEVVPSGVGPSEQKLFDAVAAVSTGCY